MKKTIAVSLKLDKEGYLGRECPNCERYFKITPGTGLQDAKGMHCPYCGHLGEPSDFTTLEQIEYAKSVALRKLTGDIHRMLKQHEGPIGPQNGFIRMSIHVKPGAPIPLKHYRERDLETKVTCQGCTLKYAVYGVFAYCPDCAEHNSLSILNASLELIAKVLGVAETQDGTVRETLVANALEDAVSSFDAFGREAVRTATQSRPNGALGCSFQNLEKARDLLLGQLGFDLEKGIAQEAWSKAVRSFQKRHLLAHRMGVVDQGYIDATGDRAAVAGRKIPITADEVRELIGVLRELGLHLHDSLARIQRATS